MSSLESEPSEKKPAREFESKEELEAALLAGSDTHDFEEAKNYVLFRLDEIRNERRRQGLLPSEAELDRRKLEYDYLVRNTKVVKAFIPAATMLYESGCHSSFDIELYRPKEEIIDSKIPMKVSLVWNFREKEISNWKYKLFNIPPHQKVFWNEVEARVLYRNESIEGISVNGSEKGIPNDNIEELKKAVNEAVQYPIRKSYIKGDPKGIPDPRLSAFPFEEDIHFMSDYLYPELSDGES